MTRLLAVLSVVGLALPIATWVGWGQDQPELPGYYNRLLDETFHDVNNVLQLGMDYALTFERKISREIIEWVAERDMKAPEDNEYFAAMHALGQGWDLLLKAAKLYHQARTRLTDDGTTRRLHAEAEALRRQGAVKVKEANRLRKAADDKRAARKRAEEDRKAREHAAMDPALEPPRDESTMTPADTPEPGRDEPTFTSADVCVPLSPKRYVGCETTLAQENHRWQREVAENDRAMQREYLRASRRASSLQATNASDRQFEEEARCHEKNGRQLQAEKQALQERHLKCFGTLMGR